MTNNNSGLKRIDRVYNDGSVETIEKGFVMYIVGQDALAEFIGIEDVKDTVALLNGVGQSLRVALKEYEQEKERREKE